MDRNGLTGLLLIMMLVVAYYTIMSPQMKPPKNDTGEIANTDSIAQPEDEKPAAISEWDQLPDSLSNIEKDSIIALKSQERFSDFGPFTKGTEKIIKVKTDKFTIELNSKGAQIHKATLNEYKTFDSLPLPIIHPDKRANCFLAFDYDHKLIYTDSLFFETKANSEIVVTGTDTQEVVFSIPISKDRFLEQIYTFTGDNYRIGYANRFVGLNDKIRNSNFEMEWNQVLPKTEQSVKNMRLKSGIVYRYKSGDMEWMSKEDEVLDKATSSSLSWISYKSQFFSSALMSEEGFKAKMAVATPKDVDDVNKLMSSTLFLDFKKRANETYHEFNIFMGPNEYNTLSSYDVGLQKQMDLGWWIIKYINIGTIYIFKLLEQTISNYGLIIILFAVVIKVVLFPLTRKSFISMAKVRVLNQSDEMKALDEKYKEDPTKLQQEKMALYRQMGANPLGGCLPQLLQMPLLFAMFFFFPQSIELRQKSFLWAHDLSTYDSILDLGFSIPFYGDHVSLFTLLMAAAIYINTFITQKAQPATGPNAQMKYLAYIFPLIFVVFLNNYSAGLSIYYFTSTLISILQTTAIRYSQNDDKILADLRKVAKAKKKGKVKKSKMEQWIETQQKKQQELSRQRSQQNNTKNRRDRRKK